MKRVTGIGGIFFKAKAAPALQAWYKRHLGIDVQAWGGAAFDWTDAEGKPTGGTTAWSIGPEDGEQFAPSAASFMINYRVEDLHALVTALRAEGCNVLDKIDESDYGKFAWVIDPEGNKVELWQPPASKDLAPLTIVRGGIDDERVRDLLEYHVRTARAETAIGSAHALDLEGLKSPDVTFWSAWRDNTLLGVGAVKQLSPTHGEIKSMHTAQAARRRGVGSALLRHVLGAARQLNLKRLSLETGSWPYFDAARALYTRHGFVECPPFADYVADPNSIFMTLDLADQP